MSNMWPTIILSSGLMLLVGCAFTGIILLRRQIRNGVTGFGMLATSDSVLNTVIGATLIGQTFYKEDARMKTSCSQTMLLVSATTFFLSFANSFISMLIMATECYANEMIDKKDDKSERKVQKTNKKRLTVEIGLQWTLPILLIAILHQVTPTKYMAASFKQTLANHTCQVSKLLSEQMSGECYDDVTNGEETLRTNNLTVAIVKQIFELLRGSADKIDSSDQSTIYLDPPQTKEEWKGIFMKTHSQEINNKDYNSTTSDLLECDESCAESFKKVQTIFFVIILLIYFIPTIGTAMLHYLSKNNDMKQKTKTMVDPEEAKDETLNRKACHLKEIKLIALSNLLMWTPSIVKGVAQRMFCSNIPLWLEAMLYIIGQMNTVIRGLIHANAVGSNKLFNKNIVVPLEPKLDCSTKDFTSCSTENTEALFEKRIK